MKKVLSVALALAMLVCAFAGCSKKDGEADTSEPIPSTNLGDDSVTFGEDLSALGVYDGYFEYASTDVSVACASGTPNAYSLSGTTLTFSGISEDSVYSVTGKLCGNIVIDIPEEYKLELELTGLSLVSTEINPIQIKSGSKVSVTAKKDTANYIYDMRQTIDESDTSLTKGAIHSEVDLQVGGKGSLTVVSASNNGIHTKDDLEVKNLTLTVVCADNALKGNDSVEISSGEITLISICGDGIKTSNSDISSKGNQRGGVSITGGNVTVYAACDGIDAAHNVLIEGEEPTVNIYTDKYSNYSSEVTATEVSTYYIRCSSNAYKYSVKYYNSDSDFVWVNPTYSELKSNSYYYSFDKMSGYSKLQVYVYSSDTEQGQSSTYAYRSSLLTLNNSYDTIYFSRSNGSFSWTNYATTTQQGGNAWIGGGMHGGGMNDGNTDKGDYSTKGIKAANEIVINGGELNIKSYDDSLHADNQAALENGASPLGNITVNGGNITLYSNDDGAHAEGTVCIKGGNVSVVNSYEGVEGSSIEVSGGNVSVSAKDDGMNSTATSGTGITLSGGYVYIYCTGDGLDTNSKTSYAGISFEGGDALIIANSNGNSAIDTEQGYKYTSGSIVAIMPKGGMTGEATHCKSFSSVGSSKTVNIASGSTLTVSGDMNKTVIMPCPISNAFVVVLNKSTSVSN